MADPKPQKNSGGSLQSIAKAERLTQIALIMPCAVFIGWAAGAALDHWLHQHWIYIVGLIFGAVAGLIEAVRQALSAKE